MLFSEFMLDKRQPIPEWLERFPDNPNSSPRDLLRNLLNSRLVYYPGSGTDGRPIAEFNIAHAASCFIYVDYLLDRKQLLDELEQHSILGYRSIAKIELNEADFAIGAWESHLRGAATYTFQPGPPYAFINILERLDGYSEEHGQRRIAVLFLAADAHATFDALFCQKTSGPPPYCIVLQDHGSGENYSPFGQGGHLSQIAFDCRILPQLLLVAENTQAWRRYYHRNDVETLFGRSIWERL